MRKLSKQLKALANERRLAIIKELTKEKQLNVLELANRINLAFRSTSKHLQQMEAEDILTAERQGNYTFYSINDKNDLIKKVLPLI